LETFGWHVFFCAVEYAGCRWPGDIRRVALVSPAASPRHSDLMILRVADQQDGAGAAQVYIRFRAALRDLDGSCPMARLLSDSYSVVRGCDPHRARDIYVPAPADRVSAALRRDALQRRIRAPEPANQLRFFRNGTTAARRPWWQRLFSACRAAIEHSCRVHQLTVGRCGPKDRRRRAFPARSSGVPLRRLIELPRGTTQAREALS